MGPVLVIWFLYGVLFFLLFLLSAICSHSNPKVSYQLAIFSLLFSISSILTTAGRIIHADTTADEGYRLWLYYPPPPMQLAFPCLSIILYNAIFDAQRQFFKFYATVLSNYGRWSALHMNPRISKLSSTMNLPGNDRMHMNPISIWQWSNFILLVIYGLTVISILCCQFILDTPTQLDGLSLSKAICVSILSICVLLNLASSIYARHKINIRYSLTYHAPKKEREGFKYATSTSTSSSALVPKDNSKQSLLILVLLPVFFLAASLTITFEMWLAYGAQTRSSLATDVVSLSPSVSATISTIDLIIECLFVCIPVTLLVILHVFYVKSPPLIVASHDRQFLP